MFPWFQNSLKFSGKVGSRFITIDCRIWPDWIAKMMGVRQRNVFCGEASKLTQMVALWAVVLLNYYYYMLNGWNRRSSHAGTNKFFY